MQNRDVLWAISIPFRMYSTKEMDVNTFTFLLSFDAGLPNCTVNVVRKLVHLAIEKGWIENINDKGLLRAKFELWEPKNFPPRWRPKFTGLEKVPLIDLSPLDSAVEYKPRKIKKIKKPEPTEVTAFSIPEPIKEKKTKTPKKKKRETVKEEVSKEEEPEDIITKPKPKKKKASKQRKKKGQKSIQDFFG